MFGLIVIPLIGIIIYSIFNAINTGIEAATWEVAACIIVPIVSVIIIVTSWKSYNKKSIAFEDSSERAMEILDEAEDLNEDL